MIGVKTSPTPPYCLCQWGGGCSAPFPSLPGDTFLRGPWFCNMKPLKKLFGGGSLLLILIINRTGWEHEEDGGTTAATKAAAGSQQQQVTATGRAAGGEPRSSGEWLEQK